MSNLETIIHRSNCFKLLAACFYEPDKQLFTEEKVTSNLCEILGYLDPELSVIAADLKSTFESSSEEQLKVDYAALFVGPFELLAAPYGSVYLETGARVLGESTLAVQKFYEEAGLSLDIQEPADHVAIELEFMHYLATQEAEAAAAGQETDVVELRRMQAQFLNQFMTWVPEFCERIEKGATADYYRYLGQCLTAFFMYCKQHYITEELAG